MFDQPSNSGSSGVRSSSSSNSKSKRKINLTSEQTSVIRHRLKHFNGTDESFLRLLTLKQPKIKVPYEARAREGEKERPGGMAVEE